MTGPTAWTVLLAIAWAAVAAAVPTGATRRRAIHVHLRAGTGAAAERPGAAPPESAPQDRPRARSRSPAALLGARVRALTPSIDPTTATGEFDRRLGWSVIASACLLPVALPLAPLPVMWTLAVPTVRRRSARRRAEAAVIDQVPDVVDLLALTTAAGLPVSVALTTIGARPGGPAGEALARAGTHIARGGSTAGALEHLASLGHPARPLLDALSQHDRYGTPLLPALDRVAIEARARRRRRAEEAARRLPVTLLFPLVTTTLPAFVLLTVVPLLAGSLSALGS